MKLLVATVFGDLVKLEGPLLIIYLLALQHT